RSVWEGVVNPPKTEKSKAPVPVIGPLAKILDGYREQCGNPAGPMFATSKGTTLSLNNVLNRQILPALRKARISWHGWHSYRRGIASNLHMLGISDLDIQKILRHSSVAVTQKCYIKTTEEQSIAAMKKLETAVSLSCANCAPTPAASPEVVVQ